MDNVLIVLAVMAFILAWAAFQAWRIGNERRDVALLGAMGGLCAAGTAVAAWA